MSANTNQSGYTLPELLVVLSVFGILSVGLLGIFTNYFAVIIRNNALVDMTVAAQGFLSATEENLRYGAGVRQTNTIPDANAPSGGWNTSNSIFVIIISVPAVDSDRNYIIDTATGDPYSNELVYYRQDNLLLQRTLANPNAIGNMATSTCPPASAGPGCPPDKELLQDLDTIEFVFYDRDDSITPDPLLARSVAINLKTTKSIFSDSISLDNTVRVTFRNRF